MVQAVLIGSRALKYWYPNYPRGKNSDYDIILSKDHDLFTLPKNTHGKVILNKIEVEFDDKESNRLILEKSSKCPEVKIDVDGLHIMCNVADPQILLAIKKSHRHFQDNWHKNIKDYLFLKSMVELDEECDNICRIRLSEKTGRSGRSLNMSNDDFFNGSQRFVKRKYVHDDIHFGTCFYDKPLWTRCKENQDLAKIDKHLFDKLDHSDKIRMAQEEAFVIALERMIIPTIDDIESFNIDNQQSFKAYSWAVMRLGTTLTSGWFREFVIDNYVDIMAIAKDVEYINKFLHAVRSGNIREV